MLLQSSQQAFLRSSVFINLTPRGALCQAADGKRFAYRTHIDGDEHVSAFGIAPTADGGLADVRLS
jgi:hypothetical protein